MRCAARAIVVAMLALACDDPDPVSHSPASVVLLSARIDRSLGRRTLITAQGDTAFVITLEARPSEAKDSTRALRSAQLITRVVRDNWPDRRLQRVTVVLYTERRFGFFLMRSGERRYSLDPWATVADTVVDDSATTRLLKPR